MIARANISLGTGGISEKSMSSSFSTLIRLQSVWDFGGAGFFFIFPHLTLSPETYLLPRTIIHRRHEPA